MEGPSTHGSEHRHSSAPWRRELGSAWLSSLAPREESCLYHPVLARAVAVLRVLHVGGFAGKRGWELQRCASGTGEGWGGVHLQSQPLVPDLQGVLKDRQSPGQGDWWLAAHPPPNPSQDLPGSFLMAVRSRAVTSQTTQTATDPTLQFYVPPSTTHLSK